MSAQDLLPVATTMGTLTLKVGDLASMSAYYAAALGLAVLEDGTDAVVLGRQGSAVLRLEEARHLRLPNRGEAGLFHTALLFPDRADLAAAVASAARHPRSAYVGSADHLVSEAFYFSDPEGNGIELYFDRPRETWAWTEDGQGNREVTMGSLPLPPRDYIGQHLTEAAASSAESRSATVGHVHLQVGDVETAHRFYVDVLGFERTAGWHDQALFVSAGGYHHHMAMNVWNSRGAGPRRDTLGLGEVLIRVPAADEVAALADRLAHAGIANHHTGAELRFEDPWRNRLRVAVDAPSAGVRPRPS
ncbi:VOC family protein [Arthrobacter agilis]|jgi:catechol 2,3-dioxygenase|uniref:VOC family protein n=1 Tax=Arthrobacter agilis TaxID=37921 RepID=UPI0027800D42|nr:VOC family protein [Arthrobacter agilis]MDQ0735208.1 catechol 2,3-dioxygenase [Arthrobacter agilis]